MDTENRERLSDIRTGPWREKSSLAREKLKMMTPEDACYFRPHSPKDEITDRSEIAFRESFDQALEELQLLELATATGYLPLNIVRPVAEEEIGTLLALVAARNYLVTYDFVSVRFMAARLGIDLGLRGLTPPEINPKAAMRFAIFLAVHAEFVQSEAIEKFTMLLDDYEFANLIDADFFKRRLAGAKMQLSDLQQRRFAILCIGLVQFVQSLGDLFLQLQHEERPLYGSIYAYWLGHFFGVRCREGEYRTKGTSFEDINPNPLLFPRDLARGVLEGEQLRFRHRVGVLRSVWD